MDALQNQFDNLSAALGRLVYATRNSDDPGIKKARETSVALIKSYGIANPLRAQEGTTASAAPSPLAAPTAEQARAIGAKGAEPFESERLLFEAWMRGHCWAVSGTWDGKTYITESEKGKGGWPDPQSMLTRQLWAAWRDRAALTASHSTPSPAETESDESSSPTLSADAP